MKTQKILSLTAIGCGSRTRTYFELAARQPHRYRLLAAADLVPERLAQVRELSKNQDFKIYNSAEELLAQPKLADVLVIGTQDHYHFEPCMAAMKKGYDILLEKPIAPTLAEVLKLESEARRLGRKVLVCHVLRYSPFYQKIKEIILSGVLGEIQTIDAVEGTGAWHQAHSFVRGHWAVSEKSSPMIVAKCCHDMDIIAWLMNSPCRVLSSFGNLSHFNGAHAPEGAPERCTEGCPAAASCAYDARLYTTKHRAWLKHVFDGGEEASDEEIIEWLGHSPWGRCVYRCQNNVVDHQVIAMQFENRATATFTMTAFDSGRTLSIHGSKGDLRGGDFYKKNGCAEIVIQNHSNQQKTMIQIESEIGGYGGHGGGDPGLVNALYEEMQKSSAEEMTSSITQSLQSHLMAFAAEESRVTGQTIDLNAFRERV